MSEKTLEQALQEAGLNSKERELIVSNSSLALALVTVAKRLCAKLDEIVKAETCIISGYRGKFDVSLIPGAVAALKSKGMKVNIQTVAKELGWKQTTFNNFVTRHPEVRNMIYTLRAG